MALHFFSHTLPAWLDQAQQSDESTTWRQFEVHSENLKIYAPLEKIWDVIRNEDQLDLWVFSSLCRVSMNDD